MRLLHLVPKNTKIDFVGIRWWAFSFTIITFLVTFGSLAYQGLNLGIDFTGGVVIEVQKKDGTAADLGELRGQLGGLGFGEVNVQTFGEKSDVLIRVQPTDKVVGQEQVVVDKIKETLSDDYLLRRQDAVGPKVSGELFFNGVIATLASVLMIAVYVAFRFEWQFGIAAFVATFHDVFVVIGLFSVTQLDFNLTSVAAVLTLAGYSINDTVVVFDRIRENKRRFKKMPLPELINLSTNQTLSRTIMTSICTALSVIPLVLYGGEALYGFSVAILFGIVIGTYSSIYVASALLLYMKPIGTMDRTEAGNAGTSTP
jgi:preprotein translocase subunit SecF